MTIAAGGARALAAPGLTLDGLFGLARERGFDRVEIRLPAQMPFVRVPEVRAALAAAGLRCGAVACDARLNAPGRLKDGADSLRQAARAAAALGAAVVPFTIGANAERDVARAAGLVGHELKSVAALAAAVGVRLAIETGRVDADEGPGEDPSRTLEGTLRVIAAAGSPRSLGLVLPSNERAALPLPAEPRVVALREEAAASGPAASILVLAP